MNRGKPNWEHLSEDLHVLITVEDTHNRAKIKLQRAINEVKKLLVPAVSISIAFYVQNQGKNCVTGSEFAVLVCMEGGRGIVRPKVCVYMCVFVPFFVCVSVCMREYV